MMIEYWLQNWLTFWPDGRSFRILSELGVVFGTDRGPVRNSNQDRVVVIRLNSATPESSFICAIVCDGMGGMKHGDVCASIGIASFVDRVIQLAELGPHESMLKDAIRFANESVHRFAKGSGGTTLSAVLISGNSRAWWANVGDSRVYGLANNRKGEMVRLTVDDTLEEAFGGHG